MKHNFKDGKWMPENGTFVKVPNEQIPEVIQLLRDNGYRSVNNFPNEKTGVVFWHGPSLSWYNNGGEYSEEYNIKIPLPDFKALVTGKLPESWCIQCTEESMKHEAFTLLCKAVNVDVPSQPLNCFVGSKREGNATKVFSAKPFGEVLQIETWAALNPVEETTEKPCTCKPVPADAFPDEPLIRVLKSRGYTVRKNY